MANKLTRRRFLLATGLVTGTAGCGELNTTPGSTPGDVSSENASPVPAETPAGEIEVLRWRSVGNEQVWETTEANMMDDEGITTNISASRNSQAHFLKLQYDSDEIDVTNPRNALGRLIVDGKLVDLTDLVARSSERHGALIADTGQDVDGLAPHLPHGVQLPGILNYRADIYDALGLSVPTTWTELVDNVRIVDESDEFDVGGIGLSRMGPKGASDFTTILYNAGGRVWRWRGQSIHEAEVDFEPSRVRTALECMDTLSENAQAMDHLTWGGAVDGWARESFAHCLFPNAWLCGQLYERDRTSESIAFATDQALFPVVDPDVDPDARCQLAVDGWSVLRSSDHVPAGRAFLRHLYEDPDTLIDLLSADDPMRYLPPFEDLTERPEYYDRPIFRANDEVLQGRHERCIREFVPAALVDSRPRVASSLFSERNVIGDMVRSVLVEGNDVEEAITVARSRLEEELEQVRDAVGGS